MLENTRIWTHGPMNLYVNNKPSNVYITRDNVKKAFTTLKNTLAKQGEIPIGIDHLPTEVINNNPILQKLDLLNVGNIHDVDYDKDTDSIFITSATLTNPLLKQLYDDGELSSVSIVATSNVNDCPQDFDYVVHETNIHRVDIVGAGACETCTIPDINKSNTDTVYARLPINKESQIMAEENQQKNNDGLTAEEIQETVKMAMAEALKPFDERLKKVEEKISEEEPEEKPQEEEEEIQASNSSEELNKIEEARRELAVTAVDVQIQAGKVLPSQKEAMIELATKDMSNFNSLMKEQPIIVDLGARQSVPAKTEDNTEELTKEELNMKEVTSYFTKE